MNFVMGMDETELTALMSTEKLEIALISDKCQRLCDVPEKLGILDEFTGENDDHFTSFEMTYFERGSLQYNTLSGHWLADDFRASEQQSSEFEVPLIAIENALITYKSPFSGYVGLAPPYSLEAQKDTLLWRAYKNG